MTVRATDDGRWQLDRMGDAAIPIGLIQITRESVPIEGWAPRAALAANAVTKPLVDAYDQAVAEFDQAVPAFLTLFTMG